MTMKTEKPKRRCVLNRKVRRKSIPQRKTEAKSNNNKEFALIDSAREETGLATDIASAIVLHSVPNMPRKRGMEQENRM